MAGVAVDGGWAPDFIGIGGIRCATTWCWTMLDAHPDCCMSQPKELDYLGSDDGRDLAWYRRHFRCPDAPVSGEISPRYLIDPLAPGRCAELFPEAVAVAVLREPRDRAMSHLLMDAQDVLGSVSGIDDAQLRELAADPKYLDASAYAQALERWIAALGRERVRVLYYDHVSADAAGAVAALYRSVGLRAEVLPEGHARPVNRSGDIKHHGLFRALRGVSGAMRSTSVGRAVLESIYRRTRLRERIISGMRSDAERPERRFADIFGSAADHRLQAEAERLSDILGEDPPEAWRS